MTWLNDFLLNDESIGFVYLIEHKETGEFYIGKKQLYSIVKKVKKDSNWKNYYGSNKRFLNYIKQEGKDKFNRYILMSCKSKIELTYFEIEYQVKYDWLSDKCFNDNILGKFYKSKLKK